MSVMMMMMSVMMMVIIMVMMMMMVMILVMRMEIGVVRGAVVLILCSHLFPLLSKLRIYESMPHI
jgi:hypothetical protein